MVAHIQLKFGMWIRHRNMQVKFEVGLGPMIFDRVSPLELRKKSEIFRFRSLSLQRFNTFNSNLVYGYATVQAFEKLSFHPYEFPSLDFTVGGGIRTDTSSKSFVQ